MRPVPRFAPCAVAAAALFVGCADEPARPLVSSIDLSPVIGDRAIHGVSLSDSGLDVIVDGLGILSFSRAGALLAARAPGERGLQDLDYKDVASLGDEVFVLLADQEGYLYDALTESQRVHFCVEPDWEPEEPVEPGEPNEPGPPVAQRNDALAASGNLIVAAPRFYDAAGALVQSALRTYRAGDGTLIEAVDLLPLGLELRGLALAGDEILGLQGNELHRFSLAGEHLGAERLAGLVEASGAAVDAARGELFVSDEREALIRVYER
jgi:hypothetical protein